MLCFQIVLADSTPLFDRCTERIDRGTEILLVEPCAGRAESGDGQEYHAPLSVTSGVRSLLDRTLLSRGERRIGAGPLRSPRLALRASALLRDAAESFVLCPRTSGIRRLTGRSSGQDQCGTSPQLHERLVGCSRFAFDKVSRAFQGRTGEATVLSTPQPTSANVSHQNENQATASVRN